MTIHEACGRRDAAVRPYAATSLNLTRQALSPRAGPVTWGHPFQSTPAGDDIGAQLTLHWRDARPASSDAATYHQQPGGSRQPRWLRHRDREKWPGRARTSSTRPSTRSPLTATSSSSSPGRVRVPVTYCDLFRAPPRIRDAGVQPAGRTGRGTQVAVRLTTARSRRRARPRFEPMTIHGRHGRPHVDHPSAHDAFIALAHQIRRGTGEQLTRGPATVGAARSAPEPLRLSPAQAEPSTRSSTTRRVRAAESSTAASSSSRSSSAASTTTTSGPPSAAARLITCRT